MRKHIVTSVALLALALMAESALAQSKSNPATDLASKILAPFHIGTHATLVPSGLPPTTSAVALGLAATKTYQFASGDYPGGGINLVLDENTSAILGVTEFSNTSLSGFTLRGGVYQMWVVPGGSENETLGINTSGQVVGIYVDASDLTHGFVQTGNNVKNIDEPDGQPGQTAVWDISDKGVMVGSWEDGSNVTHGFSTKDGVTFTSFDYPGSTYTQGSGINKKGDIVGWWEDSSNVVHGFLYSKGVFSSIDFPLATTTYAYGINDSGAIAGFFTDASMEEHGFLYSGGSFYQVDVAGAASTQLVRVKNSGAVTGVYTDALNGEEHGLTGQ